MTYQRRWHAVFCLAAALMLLAGCGDDKAKRQAKRRRPRARRTKPVKPTVATDANAARDANAAAARAAEKARLAKIDKAIGAYVTARAQSRDAARQLDALGLPAVERIVDLFPSKPAAWCATVLAFFPRGDERDPAIVAAVVDRSEKGDPNDPPASAWLARIAALDGAAGPLLKLLDDPTERATGLRLLVAQIQAPEVIAAKERIAALAGDPDAVVRAYAASLLTRLDPLDARAVPGLIAGLSIPDQTLNATSIDGLGMLGPAAGKAAAPLARYIALGSRIFEEDRELYSKYERLAKKVAPTSRPTSRPTSQPTSRPTNQPANQPAKTTAAWTRGHSVAALAAMGPEARKAIPTLVDGAIPGDRHAAISCEALARLEPTADELPFDKLRDAMVKTKSPDLVAVVGHCGPKAADAIASLWDDPAGVGVAMESAMQAYFEQAGAAAAGAVAKLVPRLLTGDQDSASSASRALASIGEPSAEPLGEAFREQFEIARSKRRALRKVLTLRPTGNQPPPTAVNYEYDTEGADARRKMLDVLKVISRLGPAAAGAVPDVASAVFDTDTGIVEETLKALVEVGEAPSGTMIRLMSALNGRGRPLAAGRKARGNAILLLAKGSSKQPGLLRTMLMDKEIRGGVLSALKEHLPTNPACATALSSVMRREEGLQRAIIPLLGQMGPQAVSAVPALKLIARRGGPYAAAAQAAMARIGGQGSGPDTNWIIQRYIQALARGDRRGAKEEARRFRGLAMADLDNVVRILTERMAKGTVRAASGASLALRDLGPAAKGAAPALLAVAEPGRTAGPRERLALLSLAAVAPDQKETLAAVTAWLMLGRSGEHPPRATGSEASDLAENVAQAVRALLAMEKHAAPAYPTLARLARESKTVFVYQKGRVLAGYLALTQKLGPAAVQQDPNTLDQLLERLTYKSRSRTVVSRTVVASVVALGPEAAPATAKLLEAYETSNKDKRILDSLWELGIHDYQTALCMSGLVAASPMRSKALYELPPFVDRCAPSAKATAGLLKLARQWDPNEPMHAWVIAALTRTAVPVAELTQLALNEEGIEAGLAAAERAIDPLVMARGPYARYRIFARKEDLDKVVTCMLRPDRQQFVGLYTRLKQAARLRSGKDSATVFHARLRQEAAELLVSTGTPPPAAVDALSRRLRPASKTAPWALVRALGGGGDQWAAALMRARPVGERGANLDCALLTGATGRNKQLAEAYLRWRMRAQPTVPVVGALRSYGRPASELVPVLVALMDGGEKETVLSALAMLGEMGPDAAGAAEAIGKQVQSGHIAVRIAAEGALQRIGTAEAPTTKPATTAPAAGSKKPSAEAARGRISMAKMMIGSGAQKRAGEILKAVLAQFPGTLEAEQAAALLKEMGVNVPEAPAPTTQPASAPAP